MVDFHTHILPGLDDGSKNLTQSIQMLRMEKEQGIGAVVLTPHYYSTQQSPEAFLSRRQRAWERLTGELEEGMPKLLLGAEVQYFDTMENLQNLNWFCIRGTRLLLLEMPFDHWEQRVVRTVQEIQEAGEIQVVLAHVERYLRYHQNPKSLDILRRSGVLMQVNASFFDGWLRRKKALSMLRKGEFQLIGSDCHNLSTRKPNWDLVPEDVKKSIRQSSRRVLRQYHL